MNELRADIPCANHPAMFTGQSCARCGRPFCASCLTEMMGEPVCGWCRDRALREMSTARGGANPVTVVLWARIFDGVALVMGGGFSMLMSGYIAILSSGPLRQAAAPGRPGFLALEMGGALLIGAVGLVAALALYLPPLLMLGSRRSAMWVWQLAALALSVVGGCFMSSLGMLLVPFAVVLGVFWCQPQVRAHFDPA